MRALTSALLGLLCSCAMSPGRLRPPAPLQTPAPLEVISLPSPKPVVSFRLVFHTGSIDDVRGKEGLTALTAELMAEGGTASLSASELQSVLFPMAAELNVETEKEFTVFKGRVHRDHLARFQDIFLDVLLAPRWDEREFERLRADAQNRVRNQLRGEDDETLGKVALDALLYANHPYGHYTYGTEEGLQSVTLEDVKQHWKNVFTQDRLVVGVAGPVDASLVAHLKQRLLQLPRQGAPQVLVPAPPMVEGHTWILQKRSLSTAISMGHAYPLRRGHPDYFAVALALSYLGEHRQFHGTLFQELREKRGLNYGDYAYAEHFLQEGWTSMSRVNIGRTQQAFSLWLRPVDPRHAVFATRGALHFLEALRKAPPDTERLETAKGFLLGYTRLWEQTDERRLGYAIDERFYGTPAFLENYRKALVALTPQQVQQAAFRHLAPQKLNFVYVTEDAAALKKALSAKRPSLIEYPTPKPPEVLESDKALGVERLPMRPDRIQVLDAQRFMKN